MKIGKILAVLCGVGLVGLMVLMISSESALSGAKVESKNELKIEKIDQNVVKNAPSKGAELIKDEELKSIEELKQGVKDREFKVSRHYLVSCAPCHGDDGKGKIAPPINAKSKENILARLKEYKDGKIKNSLMDGLLTNVSDDELNSLADEISKFKE